MQMLAASLPAFARRGERDEMCHPCGCGRLSATAVIAQSLVLGVRAAHSLMFTIAKIAWLER